MSPEGWALVLMMVVLKIPIVAGALFVWWAIRAEPRPLEGALALQPADPDAPRRPSSRNRRPTRPRPHGGRGRRVARRDVVAARAEGRR
jgi:hypothetical protein